MSSERGDMPLVLAFIVHPTLEVPFVSVTLIFLAGAIRFRVGGRGG